MLGRGLAAAGVRVVSGLARGIDAEAHRGCLDGGGATLAILGSGLDVIYPPENAKLAEDVAESGVLLSEFLPGTAPDSYNFPRRNRLISGFSRAVVVVEAGDRSGTMITVDAALSQGRDVLAVPGEILRCGSRGSNRLLREGAGVVTCVEDILDAIGAAAPTGPATAPPTVGGPAAAVVSALCAGPRQFDDLLRLTPVRAQDLLGLLLDLEISGLVVQRPGKVFELASQTSGMNADAQV